VKSLRPRAGHVLIKPLEGWAEEQAGKIVTNKILGYQAAEVVAVGEGVDLRAGDKIVFETQSAPLTVRDEESGGWLAVVRCGNALAAQGRDEELVRVLGTKARILQAHPDKRFWSEEIAESVFFLAQRERELRAYRKGRGRSRLFNPTMDPASGEGVLAVLEEE